LASLDRTSPSFYLSVRTRYQRPGKNNTETAFLSLLRKYVGDAKLSSVSKEPSDRIVQIDFEKWDAGGKQVHTRLRLILTGRSANAHLLDDHGSLLAQFFDRGDHKAVTPEAADH